MMTQPQINDLARNYQIDGFTVFREYLQLLFLSYLYRQEKAAKIYFKGGTALHLLYDSSRFSEDLDFATEYRTGRITGMMKNIEKEMARELPDVKIRLLYRGKNSLRFRLTHKPAFLKYPLGMRLDFSFEESFGEKVSSPLVTKFPLMFFPVVCHLAPSEILAEKIRAVLTRGKGRDFFDLWFLLEKGIKIESSLVEKKLKAVGKKFEKERLKRKVEDFSLKRLELDLAKFLPKPQRKVVAVLKERLLAKLSEAGFLS